MRRMLLHIGVMAIAAAGVLAGAGCGGNAAKNVEPKELMARSADRMDRAQSFHFDLSHENGTTEIVRGLQMTTATGDVVGRDRLRLDVKAKAGPLNVAVGIIVLPDGSYITNPLTGRWEREQISIASFFDPAIGVTALMRAATEPRVAGQEKVNGVQTYRVEAKVDSGDLDLFAASAPAGSKVTARLWIGVDEPLVYRIEIDGPVNPGEASTILRRLDLTRFDEAIAITAPM